MKKFYFTFLLMLASMAAWANDSEYYSRGGQLIPIQNNHISVAKEILTINLTNDGLTNIDVYYELRNDGPETDILMGFEALPPYFDNNKSLDPKPHPYIKNFSVEMNGAVLPYEYSISQNGLTDGLQPVDKNAWRYSDEMERFVMKSDDSKTLSYDYVYSFKAHFKKGINIVRHRYSYNQSNAVDRTYWIDYKLTPATRWANHQIDDFTLRITANGTPKHFVLADAAFSGANADMKIVGGKSKWRKVKITEGSGYEYTDYYEFSVRNSVVEFKAKNYRPKAELWIGSADNIISLSYYGNITTSDGRPLGESVSYDCSDGFGGAAVFVAQATKSLSLNRRIMRNLPFAVRGYKFKNARLRNFFEHQWWYMPDASYKGNFDSSFSPREKQIVNGLFDDLMQGQD